MKKIKNVLSVILCLSMVIGLMPMTQNVKAGTKTTRYESEDTSVCTLTKVTTANSRIRTDLSNASGKAAICFYPGNYVTYTVTVEKADTYDVVMNFAANSNPLGSTVTDIAMKATVNDGTPVDFTVNNNKNYNAFSTLSVRLELAAGTNTIKIENACEDSTIFTNIDYIEITETDDTPVSYPAAVGRHEAEDAQDLGGNTPTIGTYYAQCSNSGIVGIGWFWIGNTKNYIAWTVDAEEAGDYLVTLSYCAPKVSEFLIKVNNEDWVPFDDEMDIVGKVAPATGTWNTTATIKTVVTLNEGVNTISVSGPAMDNSTGEGNFFTVYGSSTANISSANIDCIDIEKYVAPSGPVVTVDGEKVDVTDGKVTLGDAEYGYLCDGKMYAPNTEVEVVADMAFTAVKELSVTMANGAGIRYQGTAGIRFQATISSDNMDAVASAAITEGTLITAQDIYEAKGQPLELTSDYTKINVINEGWYQGKTGIYCGAICNVIESNYIRNFTARAYVTINYENADALTFYSDMGPVRTISQVAAAVKAAGYTGIEEQYHSLIDSFIQ